MLVEILRGTFKRKLEERISKKLQDVYRNSLCPNNMQAIDPIFDLKVLRTAEGLILDIVREIETDEKKGKVLSDRS